MSCIYVVLNVGLTFCVDSNTKALSISGNFPIYKNLDISISGEHSWREDDIWGSTLKVKAQKIMSNIVYHFSTDSLFTPYIGAGIGLAFYEVDYSYYSDSDSEFLYDGFVGIQIEPSRKTWVDIGYSTVVINEASTESVSSEFGYWITPKVSINLGVGYTDEYEAVAFGVLGNFLF